VKLTTAARKSLPSKDFGIPPKNGKPGKYPMNNREHAGLAKSYAKQEEEKGKLSKATEEKIVKKADAKLGEKTPTFKGKIEATEGGKKRTWTAHKEAEYQKSKKSR
jgi:hypothetical protein